MRFERGQRLYDVRTLLGEEARAHVDHILAESVSFRAARVPHCRLISGVWLRGLLLALRRWNAVTREMGYAGISFSAHYARRPASRLRELGCGSGIHGGPRVAGAG